jgi:hypothetical protein
MNSIQAQKVAEKIAANLAQPNKHPAISMPLRDTWKQMSDVDRARQIIDWIALLLHED